MSTATSNLGITKPDDNEPGWAAMLRGNYDLLDALYTKGTNDPNGNVAGKQSQVYRQVIQDPYDPLDPDVLWMCVLAGDSATAVWVKIGLMVVETILTERNVWDKNQSLRWHETSAFGEGGGFVPDQDMGWIYIDIDAALAISVPSGLDTSAPGFDAQIFVIEIEQTVTPAVVSWDETIVWDLDLAPPPELPLNGVGKAVLYYSPAKGGTWRGQWSVLE